METIDWTGKVKIFIRFGLITLLAISGIIGYAVFNHYHATKHYKIEGAKINSAMLSVRALANGKIKELPFQDGDEVQAGDVIAKIEVSVTEEEIQQLESAVEAAKQNYAELQRGQTVKVAVTRQVPVAPSAPAVNSNAVAGSSTLASLEERAKRMDELFEMGAVSAKQRDAARQKYEDALAEGVPEETPAAPSSSTQTVTEYIEQWQPTPPAVLATAESAIKQAELALNVAKQEAQQTEIIAPLSGIIYYSEEVDADLSAGEVVAKIGNSKELWLEAEVPEDFFDKISLGKKVSYTLEGKKLSGTLVEKISPSKPEENPEEEISPPEQTPPPENSPEQTPPQETQTEPAPENPEKVSEEMPTIPAENSPTENKTPSDSAEPVNDKFILKFSIPDDDEINFQPNEKITIDIYL